ncbi:1-aminocyclopropane-1-carboxylate deaminase [Amycolatopsis xylanica]|uniref:1-aminocyclopropane-1-carboxylate deaminase n=1 Tax=Amycolatopsis xylanica TaxID=589385 RepID=A0A1H2S700_9PSEU|nr:pyridoxal-phosphate dependent enzyme [Amycolatopsis xylanica]SDW26964.1 1-aminocyclopropane-1-carboxylate deaminase [Amycolatopsis xylanica]
MENVAGLRLPSPLVELEDERVARHGVRVWLKRDDLIHPEFPGNKWRKLKYNVAAAREQGASTLVTFGGAYSNHIRAVAAAGRHFGFETVGIIRGEKHEPLNDSLAYAERTGMRLEYVDRETYREKHRLEFGDAYVIPEGGANAHGVRGCRELVGEIGVDFDVLCCACGTGSTLAGVAKGLAAHQRALGFAVLKGAGFLNDDVKALQKAAFGETTGNWSIELDFHFGGYAKRKPELDEFIASFEQAALDWVYEAKMMYGLYALIESGRFERGTTLVALIA